MLSKAGHGGQEPTVSQSTLAYVSAVDVVSEELHLLRPWEAVCPHPGAVRFAFARAFVRGVSADFAEGVGIRREGGVGEEPAAIQEPAAAAADFVETAVEVDLEAAAAVDADGPKASNAGTEEAIPQTTRLSIEEVTPTADEVLDA
mmetsp:Transcript_49141/g.117056  ORF Transcript_49141/g.117056 Transcript_49141/m.117056 type:complete len:146 (-) Transcript_49141:90-527(-)